MATKTRDTSKTADTSAESSTPKGGTSTLADQLGLNQLADQVTDLGKAMADRGVQAVTDRLDGLVHKVGGAASSPKGKGLKHVLEGDSKPVATVKAGVESIKETGAKGLSSVTEKVGEVFSGDSEKKSKKAKKDKGLKFTNIVEEIDLPVSREVAYEAWTQFEQFPKFMKKVENVEQQDDKTVEWKAQIFWSHRTWTAEIVDQVPNERIVWRSKGDKGHVDGAVTFHELAPDLTRMLVSLAYYPQGLFERTGNLWRAQGRRARLELKHFRRYLTNEVLLHPDEVEGWQGEIHEGKVTKESASEEEGSESRTPDSGTSKSAAPKKSAGETPSGRPRPAAKKSTPSDSSSSKPRPAAKKTAASESASGRPRMTARTSGSSRPEKKSASSSSRSRS